MNKLRVAWLVSLVATLGSLYFSEVLKYTPCTLCWFQRIMMYTLPVYFGIAIFKNNKNVVSYTLPVTILGFFIAVYHYLEQKTDWLDGIYTCQVGVPCGYDYLNWFGFITIPFLSGLAFLIISVLSILILRDKKDETSKEVSAN